MKNFQSRLGDNKNWRKTTYDCAVDNKLFAVFRRQKAVVEALEQNNHIVGLEHIHFFRRNKDHLVSKLLPKIQGSELVGAPLRTITFNTGDLTLCLNPTTLRYAKNWANILDIFGSNKILERTNIVEIGAGYGGEAKVFFDLISGLNISRTNLTYTIFDLPSSRGLIKKFLYCFGYRVTFCSLAKSNKKFKTENPTLVISNAAICEMHGELLARYLNEVVLKADMGYFMVNFNQTSRPYPGGFSNDDFFKFLEKSGKKPRYLNSGCFLSSLDEHSSGHKLIVFNADDQKILRAQKLRKKPSFLIRLIHILYELNLRGSPKTMTKIVWTKARLLFQFGQH